MSSGNTVKDGTGTSYWLLVNSDGKLITVGGETEDAAVAGSPTLAGGRYDATPRTLDDGDAGAVAIDAAGRVHVVGAAAENAAATGNPVLAAGRFDTSLRTVTDGDTATLATDSGGRLKTVDTSTTLTLTLSLDTDQYADGDVLADYQEIADAALISAGSIEIESIVLLDKDDQAVALDLVFANASGTLGTENSAVSISDADADEIVGIVEIATGDYVDLVNSQLVTKTNVGIQAKLSATSLYVGAITRGGTPTYTASGITLKIGVKQL
jgi:hypothetical protein